jgi:hypothetical protein
MGNLLIALQTLGLALELATRIQAMIAQAQEEGRDVTDEEVRLVQSQTDKMYEDVQARLASGGS